MYHFLHRIILFSIVAAALFASNQTHAYECRVDDVETKSAEDLVKWMTFKTYSNQPYRDADTGKNVLILMWDRFGIDSLQSMKTTKLYESLVYCAKPGKRTNSLYGPKCGNTSKKLYKALQKGQFEKLPARPPASFLQYAGENLGYCFGANNGQIDLPKSDYIVTGLSIDLCNSLYRAVYDDDNKSGAEHIWMRNYHALEKKRGKICKYLPASLADKNKDIFAKYQGRKANKGKYDQIAIEKRAGFCHPGISDKLDESVIRDYTYSTFHSSKIVEKLDPGDERINNDSVRTAFSLYAMKKAGIARFMNAYESGRASKISTVLAQCFAPNADSKPKINCGFENSITAHNGLSRAVYPKRLIPAAEAGFGGEYGPETLDFMEENLGSCIRKPGIMAPSKYLEQRDFARTQQPRPQGECEDVAAMIQYFIDQPGSTVSSSGYSYERKANYSEQAWLQKWNSRKAAGKAQCINDYPKRIMTHIKRLETQNDRRELSEARARARYQQQLANQRGGPIVQGSGKSYIASGTTSSAPATISSSEAADNAKAQTCSYGYQGTEACK